jgi:hypothetical protein
LIRAVLGHLGLLLYNILTAVTTVKLEPELKSDVKVFQKLLPLLLVSVDELKPLVVVYVTKPWSPILRFLW